MKANPQALTIMRRKQVEAETGLRRSTIYHRVGEGLFPRPIPLGARAVGWLGSEVAAINAARSSGLSDEEIRSLVVRLEGARKSALAEVMAGAA